MKYNLLLHTLLRFITPRRVGSGRIAYWQHKRAALLHILSIFLVLVANFGPLVMPAQASNIAPSGNAASVSKLESIVNARLPHSRLNGNINSGVIPQPESKTVVHQPLDQTGWSILCLSANEGVTCTDHGSYIVYTFSTDNVGWGPHTLGSFKRPVSVANLGVWFNAGIHETSIYDANEAAGNISIHTFDAGAYMVSPPIGPAGPGRDVTALGAGSDFRSVYSYAGYPLSVTFDTNVDYPASIYLSGTVYVFSDGFLVPDESTYCPTCGVYSKTQGFAANNTINTNTGNFSYPTEDISGPSSEGSLSFQRTYVSEATSTYNDVLGAGWTHNHDIRLVFPNEPGGKPGYVLFKDHSSNMYRFLDHGNGTYSPYPGVSATLVKNAGTPETYTLHDASEDIYQFNAAGKVTSHVDVTDHELLYTYNTNGMLDRVTSAGDGRYLAFDYEPTTGKLHSVTSMGRSVLFGYDTSGNLSSSTDILGQNWTYEYNAQHGLTRIVDPNNNQKLRNVYTTTPGKVKTQYDGNDKVVADLTYNLDESSNVADSLGNSHTDHYGPTGALTSVTDTLNRTITYTYDENFHITSSVDALGNATGLEWSSNGANLNKITDALQKVTNLTYNAYNLPTEVEELGKITSYTYSGKQLTSVTSAGQTISYGYTSSAPLGLLEKITAPTGLVIKYEYDSHGQRTKEIVNFNNTTHPGVNEDGKYNLTTEYIYDDFGNLTDIKSISPVDPSQQVITHNVYDYGKRKIMTQRNYDPTKNENQDNLYNITTHYFYDARGNQIAVQNAAGQITRNYFDSADHLIAMVENLTGQAVSVNTVPTRGTSGENIVTENKYDDAGNLIAVIDQHGVVTRNYYDAGNRLVTVIRNLTGQSYTESNPDLVSFNPLAPDQNLRSDTYYDANNNIIATKNAAGVITRKYYDALNRPQTVVENLVGQGINVSTPPTCGSVDENLCLDTVYDASGKVIATQNRAGIISRKYYDAQDRLYASVQNLTGSFTTNTPPTSCTTPSNLATDENICTTTVYDDGGRVIATVDPRGHITRNYYDEVGRVVTTVRNLTGQEISNIVPPQRGGTDQNIRTDTEYAASGVVVSTTDEMGRVIKYEYNALGKSLRTIRNFLNGQPQNYLNQYNLISQSTYDVLGRELTTTDTLGRVNTMEYDSFGRMISTTENVNVGQSQNYLNQYNIQTTYSYDDEGQQIAVTNPKGVIMRSYYDALGRTISSVQNLTVAINNSTPPARNGSLENLRTDTHYDINGQAKELVDESGQITAYGYDALGRRISVTTPPADGFPNGVTSYSSYNAIGQVVNATDAKGVVTRYGYDGMGRLTSVIENYLANVSADIQTNVTTNYTYDANGNRLSITDGNGHSTYFAYDGLDRQSTETDPLGHVWYVNYDAQGNRISLLDANQKTTSYTYNALGLVTSIIYPAVVVGGQPSTVNFNYDAAGRRTTMTDAVGATIWQYDSLNRPTTIMDPFSKQVGYEYDPLGNRTKLTYPDNQQVSYTYNNLNRLSIVNGLSSTTSYTYDPLGHVNSILRDNGINSAYHYDDAGRLTDITNTQGLTTLSSFAYLYDANGNRIQAVENIGQPILPTATATATATKTVTATVTQTSTVTVTQTATPTVTQTPTVTATKTLTPTVTQTPTVTLTQTATPTVTQTYTVTATKTATSTITKTATSTVTKTVTSTPTVTQTFTKTITPTATPFSMTFTSVGAEDGWIRESAFNSGVGGLVDDGNNTIWIGDTAGNTEYRGILSFHTGGLPNNAVVQSAVLKVLQGGGNVVGTSPFTTANLRVDIKQGNFGTSAVEAGDFQEAASAGAVSYFNPTPVSDWYSASINTTGLGYVNLTGTTQFRLRFTSTTDNDTADYMKFVSGDYSVSTGWPVLIVTYTLPAAAPAASSSTQEQAAPTNIPVPTGTATSTQTATATPGAVTTETATVATSPSQAPAVSQTATQASAALMVSLPPISKLYAAARFLKVAPLSPNVSLPQISNIAMTINYTYDPLQRLTAADYVGGDYYHYSYDAVGNRLSQTTSILNQLSTVNYAYDDANRIATVGSVSYVYDNNGSLLSDGANTYTYDSANRLATVSGSQSTASYIYNGLGDRLQQTANGQLTSYVLDLNTGLTQVLNDGTNTYLYGNGRIAQVNTSTEYFLTDALGSVRQTISASGVIKSAKAYDPYGVTTQTSGTSSSYGYTGEQTDPTGMVYLRARYYAPSAGRFMSRDTWDGDANRPLSFNRWNYTEGNPINLTDPSGNDPRELSQWMVDEMVADASDPRVNAIRFYNTDGHGALAGGTLTLPLGCPFLTGVFALTAGSDYAIGLLSFYQLVKDHGPFDVKHRVKDYLGLGIAFGEQKNLEFSDTGNILYGYIGASIGWADQILYLGAGIAEITDPIHKKCPCQNGLPRKEYVPYTDGGLFSPTWGDGKGDFNAVTLGINLYKNHGIELNSATFLNDLGSASGLDKHPMDTGEVKFIVAQHWPYPAGFFDPTRPPLSNNI